MLYEVHDDMAGKDTSAEAKIGGDYKHSTDNVAHSKPCCAYTLEHGISSRSCTIVVEDIEHFREDAHSLRILHPLPWLLIGNMPSSTPRK